MPYKPTKYLKVCTTGAKPGDFCFLLGFPGSTMRYAPCSRLAYADEVAVPHLLQDFGRKLKHIDTFSSDRAVALKLLSSKKSLANEYKRSAGNEQSTSDCYL